ncbi:Uncharacterized protein FWK35_00028041 [Aphis craccivora]|uniref:Uncharacterized protein n=1 Tax=Aphis craccivora TaxID=307492 RepID=A0A6G0VXS3_APHCR|nr:Uncharacterized protein FWK35_00028041 [Aphis craccivora]
MSIWTGELHDNLSYAVNVKQSSIVLHSNENHMTFTLVGLQRLKQIQQCIDLYIIEKQKKLPCYQKTFETAYSLITADVNGLPYSCRRNEFTNQYIQNYDLSYNNMGLIDISFMYELLQYHYNSLSDNMILQDLGPFLQCPVKVYGHLTGGILPVMKSVISRLALTNT